MLAQQRADGVLCLQALEKVPGHEEWRVRHLMSLALCCLDAGRGDDSMRHAAAAVAVAAGANLPILVRSPQGAIAANMLPMHATRLHNHAAAWQPPMVVVDALLPSARWSSCWWKIDECTRPMASCTV
jgi:hypothetical protein